jgi:membrane fusion protein, heavy metal efflux system
MRAVPTLIVLLSALSLGACGSSEAGEPRSHTTPDLGPQPDGTVTLRAESLPYVEVAPAGAADNGAAIRAPARVSFVDGAEAQVGAPIGGRVTKVHVVVGQRVKAGDPLVTLNSPDAAASRAAYRSAASAHKVARQEVEREQTMLEQGIGIERDAFAARARLQEAEAEMERARTTVSYLGPGSGPTVVVRAPMNGTVLRRSATVGAYFEAGSDPLVEIGDPNALRVTADVFERDLPLVREGAAVEVELSSVNARLTGRVVSIGSVLATGLRTAPVYIAVEDPGVNLRSGMFARVQIEADATAGLTLPAAAVLIKDGRRHVVYVRQDENRFAMREVDVGHSIGGRVQILAGVQPGEDVVVKGALLLDGAAEQLL